ncbi:MAG: helix-turn-helix domain-containing protein [Oscillospiraceae bacterium]|nr:helix-turn-helix domain-containing protein [Oscillospiraceae bacterium]
MEIEVKRDWAAVLEYADTEEKRSERKHTRPDHKYAPGAPISLDSAAPGCALAGDTYDETRDVDTRADFERALDFLSELQRFCVIEICLKGRTYRDVAKELGRDHSTVRDVIRAARLKIKKCL